MSQASANSEKPLNVSPSTADFDGEFGGPDERRKIEKTLVRKLDTRNAFFVILYLLNYVGTVPFNKHHRLA